MNITGGFRFVGGITSIIIAFIVLVANLIEYVNGTGVWTTAARGLLFTAHILAVFVFAAVYEQHKEEGSLLTGTGMILGTIGTIIVSAATFIKIADSLGIDVETIFEEPILKVISIIGTIFFTTGVLLLGLAIILAGILSRWGGWLLIIGTFVFLLGKAETEISSILMVIAAAFSFGGFFLVGTTLLKNDQRDDIFIKRSM